MAIHVHEEIVHEDEEDSSNSKNIFFSFFTQKRFTFIATAINAPSVG
jgi:hypothetical protein